MSNKTGIGHIERALYDNGFLARAAFAIGRSRIGGRETMFSAYADPSTGELRYTRVLIGSSATVGIDEGEGWHAMYMSKFGRDYAEDMKLLQGEMGITQALMERKARRAAAFEAFYRASSVGTEGDLNWEGMQSMERHVVVTAHTHFGEAQPSQGDIIALNQLRKANNPVEVIFAADGSHSRVDYIAYQEPANGLDVGTAALNGLIQEQVPWERGLEDLRGQGYAVLTGKFDLDSMEWTGMDAGRFSF